jgi:hypothetical protein
VIDESTGRSADPDDPAETGSVEVVLAATDAWFVREGVPQFIEHPDDDGDDVDARYYAIAVAAAAATAFVELAGEWWRPLLFTVAGASAVVVAGAVDNRFVRRRPMLAERPRHRNLAAALVPATVVAAVTSAGVGSLVAGVLLGLVVAGAGSFMETFRLWKVLRWAGRQTVSQLRRVFELFGRALPLLMLFAVTLFITADLWQVAAVVGASRYWLLVVLFVLVGLVFLTLRLPAEVRSQLGPIPAEEVVARCERTPLAHEAAAIAPVVATGARAADLTVAQRVNLLLILMFTQLLQVFLVAAMISVFFFIFGVLAIQEPVINSWVGSELPRGQVDPLLTLDIGGQRFVITRELIRVCAFLGMLSGFYFTIYVITDKTYREDFFDHVLDRVRRIVVVRAVYLELLASADPAHAG